jgi:type I restriction enzyme S subunit
VFNQLIPIGNLFKLEKGELQSTKCTPGKFDFITAATSWKTHNEYAHECEALVIAVAASGSLGRTHYVDGKFISSDLCFILTPKDANNYPLNLAFYHFVFNSLRPVLVAATKSGTSKESINQANFKKYKLPYFDIAQQNLWIEKLKNTLALKNLLNSELKNQQTLLKKLRQQILQEAIEGKLTENWRELNPDVELASELLKHIQEEKEQLIKDKKIKKGNKTSKPVTIRELNIPVSWFWCKADEIFFVTKLAGFEYTKHIRLNDVGEVPVFKGIML